VLEGIFQFGAPINIWRMELDYDRWDDRKYFVVHMQIDNDDYLFQRLMEKIRGEEGIYRYPRLLILEGPAHRSITTTDWRERVIEKPYLYSLVDKYMPSQYPYDMWLGYTLGIAFDKTKLNKGTVMDIFGNEKGKQLMGDRGGPGQAPDPYYKP
jgi:hypothetical protein